MRTVNRKDTASGAAWVTPSRAGPEPWPLQAASPSPGPKLCSRQATLRCLVRVQGSGQVVAGPQLSPWRG